MCGSKFRTPSESFVSAVRGRIQRSIPCGMRECDRQKAIHKNKYLISPFAEGGEMRNNII